MFSKTDIEQYFIAEKTESLIFLAIGIVSILLSIWLFTGGKTNFYKGAAIPLLAVGFVQCIVGYTMYSRSDGHRISSVYAFTMDPERIRNEELPRVKKVVRNFVIYRWTEIILFAFSITLILFFRSDRERAFWYGLGVTLAIQAIVLLVADRPAETRAIKYMEGLEKFAGQKPSE